MTTKELTEKGAIYFSQLKTGLSQYQNKAVVMGQEEAYHFFLEKQQKEYPQNAYADFYYFCLPKEARQKADAVLGKEELLYLKQLGETIGQKEPIAGAEEFQKEPITEAEEIIFPLEERLLWIITKLNQTELLFSTIYFTGEKGKRSTWWGNYGEEYLVFWEKRASLEKRENL